MSSLRSDVLAAVFEALDVPAVTSLATVFQHVPENTQPPCVIIREVSFADEGGKGSPLFRATVKVEAYYRGTKGTEAAALADAVEAALQAGFSSASVVADIPIVESEGGEQGEDGITYQTLITARALVQPA